jgi:hypothetical protein
LDTVPDIFWNVTCLYFVESKVLITSSFKSFFKNGVFWDVTPCGSCKNQRLGGS